MLIERVGSAASWSSCPGPRTHPSSGHRPTPEISLFLFRRKISVMHMVSVVLHVSVSTYNLNVTIVPSITIVAVHGNLIRGKRSTSRPSDLPCQTFRRALISTSTSESIFPKVKQRFRSKFTPLCPRPHRVREFGGDSCDRCLNRRGTWIAILRCANVIWHRCQRTKRHRRAV